jgi:dTDP-4-amino-4,6-dideoxygalactose transaminase
MDGEYKGYVHMNENRIWNSEVGFAVEASEVGDISNAEVAASFWDRSAIFTPSGKDAIKLILQQIGIKPHQEVFISSTFGTRYVSRCVSASIFNFCQPSKVWTKQTRAAFLIHEYGVPHPRIDAILHSCQVHGIPLIEDCAHSMDLRFPNGTRIGTKGDFAVFSFKKVVPIPGGGLALGDFEDKVVSWDAFEMIELAHIEGRLVGELVRLAEATRRRRENFRILEKMFLGLGLEPLFRLGKGVSPFLFVVKAPSYKRFAQQLRREAPFVDVLTWFGLECV